MDMGIHGQVAVITGGAGEIGRTCAQFLAAEGAAVAIVDVNRAAVERVVADLVLAGHHAAGFVMDVTDEQAVRQTMRAIHAQMGHLDILVNCIGIFQATPIDDLALADWQRLLDVNLTGIFLCCQAVLPIMRAQRGGRMINIGSLAGQVGGLAAGANYSVAKAGVMCLTKSLARATGVDGITVNTINPGPVESAMVEAWPEGQREAQLERIPLGRLGQPADIAHAVVFLSSAAAAYIHGAHLDINGGLLMD